MATCYLILIKVLLAARGFIVKIGIIHLNLSLQHVGHLPLDHGAQDPVAEHLEMFIRAIEALKLKQEKALQELNAVARHELTT